MTTGRADTRTRILVSARRLLASRGYQGAGIDAIARAAGITRQAVYLHHFATKADLLIALIEHVDRVEHVSELFVPVTRARTGQEALGCLVDAIAKLWPKVHDLASVLDSARRADAEAEVAWQMRARTRRVGCEGLMRRLRREKLLAPEWTVATAADLTLDLLSHQSYDFLVDQCGWTSREFAERTKKILFEALVVKRARKKVIRFW